MSDRKESKEDDGPAKGGDERDRSSKGEGGERDKSRSRPRRERREDEPKDSAAGGGRGEEIAEGGGKGRRKRNEGGSSGGNAGGGWMSSGDATQGGISPNRNVKPVADEDDPKDNQANANNKDKHFQDDNEEVVLIPDLDEDGGGDADHRIAHAPRNVHRKIPTLAELENESKSAVPTTEDGLKLGVLVSSLVPPNMLYEPDQLWTFESLLREITDELSDVPKPVVPIPTATTATATTAKAASSSSSSAANKSKKSSKGSN